MSQVWEDRNLECSEVSDCLCDYVDDELSPSLAFSVREHIAHCRSCAHMLDVYLKTVQVARELPNPEVSSEFHNRLRRKLNAELGLKLPLVEKE